MASSRFSTEARGRKPSPVLAGSSSSLSHFNRSIFMLRFPAFPPHFLRARPSLAYANLASLRQAHCAICSPYLPISLSLSLSVPIPALLYSLSRSADRTVSPLLSPLIKLRSRRSILSSVSRLDSWFGRVHAINPTGPGALVTFSSPLPFPESRVRAV